MTQFLNCSSLSPRQLKGKNLALSLSAIVCLILTAAILLILVLYRTYKSALQRLFQYLTVVILLHLAFISMDIQLLFDYKLGPIVCQALGFFRQWTATTTYFLMFVITIYLLYLVCYKTMILKSPKSSHCGHTASLAAETSVMLTALLLPLTFLWIPFYHKTYGVYSTSCWIQKVDDDCNTSVGSKDQIIFSSILRGVMIVVMCSFVALSIMLCWSASRYSQIKKVHVKSIRQTIVLMGFFLLSFSIEITGLAAYIYTRKTGRTLSYIFWVVYDVFMPTSQLIIPTGFLVYLYSVEKFRQRALRKALGEWKVCCNNIFCLRKKEKKDLLVPEVSEEGSTTAKPSDRISFPSYTHFSIEYTGEFTEISKTDEALVAKGTKGTKYGSTSECEPDSATVYGSAVSHTLPRTADTENSEVETSWVNVSHNTSGLVSDDTKQKSVSASPAAELISSCSSTYFSIEYTGQFTTIDN